jgi:hypothetical protein
MIRSLQILVALVLCVGSLSAQIVVDPNGGGDFTDLQPAIDAAAPFSVIHVVGGSYGPVVVGKSLAIIGEPRPHISAPEGSSSGPFQPPAIELVGSGSEILTLVNLRVGDGVVNELQGWAVAGPAIGGGGFADLHVQDCLVRGPEWTNLDGLKPGAPAIRLTGSPSITVVRSELGASWSVVSEVTNVFPPDGVPAIDALNAQVVVLDSTVAGGSANETIIDSIVVLPAPCPCPLETGEGGPGIFADGITVVDSVVTPGLGSEVTHYGVPWGQQLPGVPFDAKRIDALAETLVVTEAPVIGDTYDLSFVPPPAGLAFLVLGTPMEEPLLAKGQPLFVDPVDPLILFPIAGGQPGASFGIPLDTALIGVRFGLQLAENPGPLTLSNPVIDAFLF